MQADAVIFIPGIKGTKLSDTNLPSWETVWSFTQFNFRDIGKLELTHSSAGRYYDEAESSIIKPTEIETLAYGEFLRDLDTKLPVYIFNYDWRMSAAQSGAELEDFVSYLIEKSAAMSGGRSRGRRFRRFHFVTHSLGNFVLRNYMLRAGFTHIGKVVFTVPPFLGSLDIVDAALVGEGFLPGVKANVRKILRTMPGALELLPSYPGASRFDSGRRVHSFFRFQHWQENITASDSRTALKMRKVLPVARRTVHSQLCDLQSLSAEEKARILVIARHGFRTLQSVNVQRSGNSGVGNFVDLEHGRRTKDGDGRVAHVSSCCYWQEVPTFLLTDTIWYRDYNHGLVLKDERLQRLVNRFLFGEESFCPGIPGGSIKRVVGLQPEYDEETGLSSWRADTEECLPRRRSSLSKK